MVLGLEKRKRVRGTRKEFILQKPESGKKNNSADPGEIIQLELKNKEKRKKELHKLC